MTNLSDAAVIDGGFTVATEEALSAVRSEMVDSLDTFLEHVKHTVTLMSSLLVGGAALVAFATSVEKKGVSGDLERLILYGAVGAFLFVGVLAYWSEKIVYRYFKLYVSNYIYAARIHARVQPHIVHPWLQDLSTSGHVRSILDDDAVHQFIEGRQATERHSWKFYRIIIRMFGCTGVLAGLVTLATIVAR